MQPVNFTKIVRMGTSLGIIIPSEILRAYNWKRGDRLVFNFATENLLQVKRPSDVEFKELLKVEKTINADVLPIDEIVPTIHV